MKPFKATGEAKLFKLTWRLSKKESFISGLPLNSAEGSAVWFSQFAHVLSKSQSKYPHFRLYLKNIALLTKDEHFLYDAGTCDARDNYADEVITCDWHKLYTLKNTLVGEYVLAFPYQVGTMRMKYSQKEVKEKIALLNGKYLDTLESRGAISRATRKEAELVLSRLQ